MTEIGAYCAKCGARAQPGQNYCGVCGAALAAGSASGFQSSLSGSPVIGRGEDVPYPGEAMIGAILLTIFLPFVALIAALVLRAQETGPQRREQLKNWAIASGGWLATGWVIAIVAFSSIMSAVSPSTCKGGIDLTVPPSYDSTDGKHWTGTFTCMNGATITKPVPNSQVPGGG